MSALKEAIFNAVSNHCAHARQPVSGPYPCRECEAIAADVVQAVEPFLPAMGRPVEHGPPKLDNDFSGFMNIREVYPLDDETPGAGGPECG